MYCKSLCYIQCTSIELHHTYVRIYSKDDHSQPAFYIMRITVQCSIIEIMHAGDYELYVIIMEI